MVKCGLAVWNKGLHIADMSVPRAAGRVLSGGLSAGVRAVACSAGRFRGYLGAELEGWRLEAPVPFDRVEDRGTVPQEKLVEALDGKENLVMEAGGKLSKATVQRHDVRRRVGIVPGNGCEKAIEFRRGQVGEALAQSLQMVAQADGVLGIVPDRAGRVVARFQEQDEIADLGHHGAGVVKGRPTDRGCIGITYLTFLTYGTVLEVFP